MDALEAIGTARTMRWFEKTPVPPGKIQTLLWAATRAPNPGNSQSWQFLVVTDEKLRSEIGRVVGALKAHLGLEPAEDVGPEHRALRAGSLNLIENFGEVPVLVFVCGRNVFPPQNPQIDMLYSAMYGAAQNMLIAARATGLGAAMTSFHAPFEDELRPLLGIPDDVHIGALIPVGFPARGHGPVRRRPIEEVVHWDRWQ